MKRISFIKKESVLSRSLIGIACAVSLCIFPTNGLNEIHAKKVTSKLTAPTTSLKDRAKKQKRSTKDSSNREKIAGKLNFVGYDKKTGSAKETFFVDNGTDINISSFELEISYYNSAGKQIHKRKVEINQVIPAGESRMVDIPSWDTQKSFHYVKSTASSKGSTPYTVRFRVLSYSEYKK